ncbi:LPS translocon maturation chaperone LptM [Dokdonella koreensis]|uniref:Lipoprotein n=1 Tax=Dokdonella koreensis DS-123 TaxID=1300342 RepID=A0A167GM76_9GAMM|nr:lipoprotein [Dokdonella koreensis]ANB16724.1 Hypothetical protein I596_688 [Dokdonella koreensis DS-123]
MRKSRLIFLLSTSLLVLCLAACGNKGDLVRPGTPTPAAQ